jgi:hypothetical protein
MDYMALSAQRHQYCRPDIIGCYENSRESACVRGVPQVERSVALNKNTTVENSQLVAAAGKVRAWGGKQIESHPERPIEKSRACQI